MNATAKLAMDVDATGGDGVPAPRGAVLVAEIGPDLGFDAAIVVHVESREWEGTRAGTRRGREHQ